MTKQVLLLTSKASTSTGKCQTARKSWNPRPAESSLAVRPLRLSLCFIRGSPSASASILWPQVGPQPRLHGFLISDHRLLLQQVSEMLFLLSYFLSLSSGYGSFPLDHSNQELKHVLVLGVDKTERGLLPTMPVCFTASVSFESSFPLLTRNLLSKWPVPVGDFYVIKSVSRS